MDLSVKIRDEIIKDVKVRIFDECFPRIRQCVGLINENQLWHRSNENSNSIGNLILHLCGNIRQYIVSGIGGAKDVRERHLEFSEPGPLSHDHLNNLMKDLLKDVSNVLEKIKAEDLILIKEVQGFTMSVTSILIHVTEHLSYHTGQIAFYTKQIKDVDLKFYGDMDLDVRSVE